MGERDERSSITSSRTFIMRGGEGTFESTGWRGSEWR